MKRRSAISSETSAPSSETRHLRVKPPIGALSPVHLRLPGLPAGRKPYGSQEQVQRHGTGCALRPSRRTAAPAVQWVGAPLGTIWRPGANDGGFGTEADERSKEQREFDAMLEKERQGVPANEVWR